MALSGHIAVLRTQIRPIVTDGAAWYVGLSVCRYVCRDREPCKNGSTDRDAVWGVESGDRLKEPCSLLDGVQVPHATGEF